MRRRKSTGYLGSGGLSAVTALLVAALVSLGKPPAVVAEAREPVGLMPGGHEGGRLHHPEPCPQRRDGTAGLVAHASKGPGPLWLVSHCTSAGLSAPTDLVAQAVSTTAVSLTWTASPNAPVGVQYEVWRAYSNTTTLVTTVSGNSATDSVSSGFAYLYRVRAVDATGRVSAWANADLAITFFFEEAITPQVTLVKAAHLTELRTAIDKVRVSAGLAPGPWVEAVGTGLPIRAEPILELRTLLTEAWAALRLPVPAFSTPAPAQGGAILAVHLQELRNVLK